MFKYTHGSPDEMQVWIACGIALYLTVFPLIVVSAAIIGVLLRSTATDEQNAAATSDESPGPTHKWGVAPGVYQREPSVETAA